MVSGIYTVFPAVIFILLGAVEASLLVVFEVLDVSLVVADMLRTCLWKSI